MVRASLSTFGVIFLIINTAIAEDWKYESTMTHVKFGHVVDDINMASVSETLEGVDLVTCSTFCNGNQSLSLYFVEAESRCYCSLEYSGVETSSKATGKMFGNVTTTIKTYRDGNFRKWHIFPTPSDCKEIYDLGYQQDGVYTVEPGVQRRIDVQCDMVNGGWTVIQTRFDGSQDFDRDWEDYVQGFGHSTGEYWLGLQPIYLLVRTSSRLLIEMEVAANDTLSRKYAEYSEFSLTGNGGNYTLTVNGYSGSAGDSLEKQSGHMFSTRDRDNDAHLNFNCAENFHGGFWFHACFEGNLNGPYFGAEGEFGYAYVWARGWGHFTRLTKSVMKVIRN